MLLPDVELFVCPQCAGDLSLAAENANRILPETLSEGTLLCRDCRTCYPIVRGLPRFVLSDSYAASFGFQWNRFSRIQLDSVMNNDLSRDRFFKTTGWPARLEGQRILEAGCGAGRFTQLALETGAEVFSFDLSSAVESAAKNNDGAARLHLFQASIYSIPLRKRFFDKVFCMGVLQHCPDVRRAFLSLVPYLREGGEIVIDVYEKEPGFPKLKYLVRPFVRRIKTETLYNLLSWTIPPAFEVKKSLTRIPGVGAHAAKLIPIGPISHKPRLNYTDEELKQVKILSALDMFSPAYDQPQKLENVQRWFTEAGLTEVEMSHGYNGINAKAKRPA